MTESVRPGEGLSRRRQPRFVAISSDGVIEVHAGDDTGNYATLCGVDGDDPHPDVMQFAADLPKKPKITCEACWRLFRECQNYKRSDFSREERTSRIVQTALSSGASRRAEQKQGEADMMASSYSRLQR